MASSPPTHRPAHVAPNAASRPETAFYRTTAWRRFRKWFLARHPVCWDCEHAANEVHHVQRREQRPDLAYEETNCMALCASCHAKRTRRGE